MQNPRLASRYAKSLMDLAAEQNAVQPVYQDMQGLQSMIASSPELASLLKSPIIKADKKQSILDTLLVGKLHTITQVFVKLLTSKAREGNLHEIAASFIEQYKNANSINTVKLTTATALDASALAAIEAKIKECLPGKSIDLQVKHDDALIGGFVLESNNTLFDASVSRDLRDIQKQFLQNMYIPNLR